MAHCAFDDDDDLNALTSLLDDEEEDDPYNHGDPFSVKRKGMGSEPQAVKKSTTLSSQIQDNGSTSSVEMMDESKSKDELIEELRRMREQLSQRKGEDLNASQTCGQKRKETFSDALFPSLQDSTHKKKAEKKFDVKKETNQINDDDLSDLFDDEDVESGSNTPAQTNFMFGKKQKRLAHTPQNSQAPPKKESPYKCKLCDQTFDSMNAFKVHEFKHRVKQGNCCDTCGKSFTDKLQLQTHLRTHKISNSNSKPRSSNNDVDTPTKGNSASFGASKQSSGGSPGSSSSSSRSDGKAVERKNSVPQIGSGSKRSTVKEEVSYETEYFSKIRIVNPTVSSAAMKERMKHRKMLRMSILNHYCKTGDVEGDWVTMGVIVTKYPPKTDCKGKLFSRWMLNDLSDTQECITLLLFGKVHEEHWKTSVGSVIGILNATVMSKQDGTKRFESIALTVDHPQKLLMMGKSKDYGICRGRKKNGEPCTLFVNTSECQHCHYHAQAELKKMAAKRADLSSSYSGVVPQAHKKLFKNKTQFMYGGKSFGLTSLNTSGSNVTSQSKMTNHFNSNKVSLKSLGVKGTEAIVEDAKKSVLTLHGKGKNEEDTLVKVTGASKEFTDLLNSPSPGAQNLMRQMVKVEKSAKPVSTISANELLKQHQQEMKSKMAARKKDLAQTSNVNIGKSKPLRQTHLSQANIPDSPLDMTPKLGRGFSSGGDIDLELSPVKSFQPNRKMTTSQLAMQKALLMVKKKGQIKKDDPNATKKEMDERKKKAIKRRAEDNTKDDSLDQDSSPDDKQAAKKRKTFLGQEVEMSKDELQKILKAKSSHAGLLAEYEAEMLEHYFKEMGKKEGLENKLDAIRERKVKVVYCKKCSYTWFSPADRCQKEQHPLFWHEAMQRFFRCKDCKSRTLTFDRIPDKACRSCGGYNYERTSMLKERDGPKIGGETLLVRGREEKYVM